MGPVVGLVLVRSVAPLLSLSLTTSQQVFVGIFTIYVATFNYLADSYTIYASSALSEFFLIAEPLLCWRSILKQAASLAFGTSQRPASHSLQLRCTTSSAINGESSRNCSFDGSR